MGYFSGPSVRRQWDASRGAGSGQASRVMGQATNEASTYATRQALSQGMAQGPQPLHPGTRFAAREAGDERMQREIERIQNDPTLTLGNKMNAGWNLRHGRQQGDMTGWGDYFDMLQGKNVDLGGFGRTVDYDVPTGRSYSREAGEVAPGMRGAINRVGNDQYAYGVTQAAGPGFRPTRGGWYTPEEMSGMDRWQRAQIGYDNAMNRILRGY